jgi:hypothetical protein
MFSWRVTMRFSDKATFASFAVFFATEYCNCPAIIIDMFSHIYYDKP